MPTGGRVEESCVQIQLEKKERKLSQGRNMYYAQSPLCSQLLMKLLLSSSSKCWLRHFVEKFALYP